MNGNLPQPTRGLRLLANKRKEKKRNKSTADPEVLSIGLKRKKLMAP